MHRSVGDGITCIDTGYVRPELAACYVLRRGNEAAIIETGTSRNVDRILRTLAALRIEPAQVRYVMPTHVHLDHAGGAGALLRRLPRATAVVHPRGARHLIDPGRLIAGAEAVYGSDRVRELYGEIVPIPAGRVQTAEDGSTWPLGGDTLLIRDAPGHARHHYCVWDETSRGWFSGDAFGVAYPQLAGSAMPCILPTTTPIQFEPAEMIRTIRLLMSFRPLSIHLTHFGRIDASAPVADALIRQVDAYVAIAERHHDDGKDALCGTLADLALREARAAGCDLPEAEVRELLALDIELNAQGLVAWKRRGNRD